MITASWQPHVLNSTATTPSGKPPSWSAPLQDKSLRCSSSEYRGDLGVMGNATDCLAAAKVKGGINYAVWQTNKHCFVCLLARGDPSTWWLSTTRQ